MKKAAGAAFMREKAGQAAFCVFDLPCGFTFFSGLSTGS